MISCDECQKKIVAVFDNEGSKEDEELISVHLKDCSTCRVFQEDMVKLRQRFVSVGIPSLSPAVEKELMQVAQADSLRSKHLSSSKSVSHQPFLLRFPWLTWAAGLAGVFLIVVSWLACYTLGKEVSDLKGRLETSRQELAVARHDLAVAQAAKQLEEDREREQKAISALYFRLQELEERFDRYSSPRTTFLPAEQTSSSDSPGDM